MTITLNITVQEPGELIRAVCNLAADLGGFPIPQAPAASAPPTTPAAEPETQVGEPVEPAKRRGKKAPAADVIIDQPKQTDIEDVTNAPMLTIEDARERMKQFANDGHMDCVEKALADFAVKKVSDVDPAAAGKPSPKFAAFVAKIEEFIAAKPKGDA